MVSPRASHCDDDLASSVFLFKITDGLGDLGERVRPVDDRCDLSDLEKLLQDDHPGLLVRHREVWGRYLAHERRERDQSQDAGHASEPPAGSLSEAIVSDEHVFSIRGEDTSTSRKRIVPGDIEDQVVALTTLGKVLLGVVDDVVRPERSDHLQFLCVVDAAPGPRR